MEVKTITRQEILNCLIGALKSLDYAQLGTHEKIL